VTPSLLRRLFGAGADPVGKPGPEPEYTIVFPPTMLWANHQRPHHILTQLARRHPVRCLYNDWTVRELVLEGGKLIVTKRAFRRSMWRGPLVYYFSIPEKLDYLRRHRLRPDLLVFELMDLPEAEFSRWKKRLPQALEAADIVRTTHPAITEYLHDRHPGELDGKRITTSRNGVDLELFDPGIEHPRPPELSDIDRPILGFYGNLDAWIDWRLVERLAALPDYQVVVIGGTEGMPPKVPARLLRDSSVRWIEKRPVTQIPAFLKCFDVAIFPFVVNEMTNAVDPLKVWEYLAFGKPVLATRTAFVMERPELFELVDRDSVADSVARAMVRRDEPSRVAERKAAARTRDWRLIADELHGEIVEALGLGG